jgi:hypothetical protein
MTKQDAQIFEVLVTQMRQYRDIDTVLGETFGIFR